MLNLKNKTESPIDKENKLVAARGEKGGEACDGSRGLRGKTTNLKWIRYKEIQPLFCGDFKWSVIYKNVELLCSKPETNMML